MFRKTIRNFVEKEINPHVDEWEEASEAPLHNLFADDGREIFHDQSLQGATNFPDGCFERPTLLSAIALNLLFSYLSGTLDFEPLANLRANNTPQLLGDTLHFLPFILVLTEVKFIRR